MEPVQGRAGPVPGGFLQADEDAEQGALRELAEETGLVPTRIKQLGCFSKPGRDPRERVITVAFYALARGAEVRGGDDAAQAEWFSLENLPALAFDHAEILSQAREALRRDIHFEPVGFELLSESFRMSDLQRLYEAILDRKFDRRNFQKKILSLGILHEVTPDEDASLTVASHEARDWDSMPSPDMPSTCMEEDENPDSMMFDSYFSFPGHGPKADRKAFGEALSGNSAVFDEELSSTFNLARPLPKTWSTSAKTYRFNPDAYARMKQKGEKEEF